MHVKVTCDYIRYDTVRYAQAYSTTRSFVDAFTDGNYTSNPAWSATAGYWSAAGYEMATTTQAPGVHAAFYRTNYTNSDQQVRFSYKIDSSSQSATPETILRFRRTGNDYVDVRFLTIQARIQQYKGGVTTYFQTNTSATSTLNQWYDVLVIPDGAHIEVWWGTQGSTLQKILSTDSATVLEGPGMYFYAVQNTMVHIDNIIVTADEPSTTTYQYNNANEMITMATGGVNTVFTYDAWGRTVTKTQGGYQAKYNYSFGDKLKDITSNFPNEAATVYYNYDGLGKRRNKTLDLATVTWWRWDIGWNVIQEYTDPDGDWDIENLAATFVPGLAEIPGSNPSTGSYRYYMGDHLGSVRTLRDQNKAAIASYEFMPYGETYRQSGRELYRGFTGHMLEKETGLYFAPYRYYSPVASRWLTRDPLGMGDGPNVYLYASDDPVGMVDDLSSDLYALANPMYSSYILTGRGFTFTNKQCKAACDELYPKKKGKHYVECVWVCTTLKGNTCNELSRYCTHLLSQGKKRLSEACWLLHNELCLGESCPI